MRELDWRIHEYMGNDLTGWEWDTVRRGDFPTRVRKRLYENVFRYQDIPHYSTTWEGAGLVMEWLSKEEVDHEISSAYENGYCAVVGTYTGYAATGPLALTNAVIAYISAMEEREG